MVRSENQLFMIVFKDPNGIEKYQTAVNHGDALAKSVDIATGRVGAIKLVRIFSVTTDALLKTYTLELHEGQIKLLAAGEAWPK